MTHDARDRASTILLRTPRFDVEAVRLPGTTDDNATREIIRHPGAVVILPLVDASRVCLIRNFRVAVNETLLELPAGTLEPPEEPLAAARRELAEETGYRADQYRLLHSFYASPGILDERMSLVVASGLSAGAPAREPGEMIENAVVTWNEALTLVDDGTIKDAKTIVGLLYYDRLRRRTGS